MGDHRRFSNDIKGVLSLHLTYLESIRSLINPNSMSGTAKEVLESLGPELMTPIKNIERAYNKFVVNLIGQPIQAEIEKQSAELFPDCLTIDDNQISYIKIKIIFEWVSSFYKLTESAYSDLRSIIKVLNTYNDTKSIYDKMLDIHLAKVDELNLDTKAFLDRIKQLYSGNIVGSFKNDKESLVSNLIYDEIKNFDYLELFRADVKPSKVPHHEKNILDDLKFNTTELNAIGGFSSKSSNSIRDSYYFTDIIGTKDWNRNDAYILFVKTEALKEEEKKFYNSSFVILSPNENVSINLAAAMVRKNTGYSVALKYSKMVQTLLEYAVDSLFTKDFKDICEDVYTFLYHIGPIVLYNIVYDDMIRRDFGHCFYVEKNNIIRFFPENIIRKHVIDFWAEKFFDLKVASVDSYMNYSKGVQNVRVIYKNLFEQAATTKKRGVNDSQTINEYMKENVGKFFGYRRMQVFRRFVVDCVFGNFQENNTTELVNKFK